MRYSTRTTAIFAFGFVCGTVLFMLVARWNEQSCVAQSGFVNSDIVCGEPDAIAKTSYVATQQEIVDMIDAARAGGVARAAVYFRDLKRGPVFGVNELDSFAPASLLKMPVAMVYMNAAMAQPGVLDARMRYTGSTTVALQRVPPPESAREGDEYAVAELIRFMLAYSDNASYETLDSFLRTSDGRQQLRQETFQELGFFDPKTRLERTLTVRGYASMFTLLYNASYLDIRHSDMLLGWLAESSFTAGLVAGVPKEIRVAHKFGERLAVDGTKELHDCGIIYYPRNPYLLCVMTRGSDWESQEELIARISGVVYEEVSSRRL